jgi:sugar fermentation stimulation protein A
MIVESPIVEGRLIRRYKRFLMDLQLEDGSVLTVHCPNSGSMEGCLEQGARVLASRSDNPNRKLSCTAEWIRLESGWVGINTHRANRIVEEALRLGRVPSLAGYGNVRPEVPYDGNSRVDFLLTESGLPPCYVEVKNTTWPAPGGGIGFPDAVTERGLKHLGALRRMVRKGYRAVMLYLVNREDGTFFRPAYEKDPAYARALTASVRAGVEVLACRVLFDPPEVSLGHGLPVKLKQGRALVDYTR